jgi:hypothetical protein
MAADMGAGGITITEIMTVGEALSASPFVTSASLARATSAASAVDRNDRTANPPSVLARRMAEDALVNAE